MESHAHLLEFYHSLLSIFSSRSRRTSSAPSSHLPSHLHFAMLFPTTLLALLLAFAFTALATPEPCADRVAVIKKLHHIIDLSEALLQEEVAAEAAESSSLAAAAKKSKAASAPQVASTTKIVKVVSTKKAKAAAQTTAVPVAVATSSSAPSPAATVNKWSSGTKKTTPKKKAAPVVKDPTPATINNGTSKAVDGFASSGLVPATVAKKLQEGESTR